MQLGGVLDWGITRVGLRGCHFGVAAMATTPRSGKIDSDVGKDGEEGYELVDVADRGMVDWEEGGGGGLAVSPILETAAAIDCRSIDRSN
jgi:hypothetical protein